MVSSRVVAVDSREILRCPDRGIECAGISTSETGGSAGPPPMERRRMHHEKRMALTQERETVSRDHESDGEASRDTALTRLDGEIKALCSHDSIYWDSRSADDGRIITTCERCRVTWYEHVG